MREDKRRRWRTQRIRMIPIWMKIFIVFSLLIVMIALLTTGIASASIHRRYTHHLAKMDQGAARVLAYRINQILSEKPGYPIPSPPLTGKQPQSGRLHPSRQPGRFKERDSDGFSGHEDFPKRLKELSLKYRGGSVESLIKVLVEQHPYLFSHRRMPREGQFPARALVIFRSTDGAVRYQSRHCLHPEYFDADPVPVFVDGIERGTLVVSSLPGQVLNRQDRNFLEMLTGSVVISSLIVLPLAGLLAFFLIRRITAPIHQMKVGAQRISCGDFDFQVHAKGRDELTGLAQAFNSMARRLVELESARKEMIADISHELRTPVALLQARLEMILAGRYRADQGNLELMEKDLSQLSSLIDQVHELAILDHAGREVADDEVSLIDIASETIAGFSGKAAASGIHLELVAPDPIPLLRGSLRRTAAVFRNLINNALQHTPEGGQVQMRLLLEHAGSSFKAVIIRIEDSGCGVEEPFLERIFDRFFRTDSSRSRRLGGSGLGLSLVKSWSQLMGGSVRAENNVGGGLSIIIELPAASFNVK